MLESSIVRYAILIYVIVASFALFLLWKNAAATDALKNTGILIASILPVIIAILPYINSKSQTYRYKYVLIYDTKHNCLTTGESWNVYAAHYSRFFSHLSDNQSFLIADSVSEFAGEKGMNLIERGVVELLEARFMTHWNMVWQESKGPVFNSSTGQVGDTKENTQIPLNELMQHFGHNAVMSEPGVMVGMGINIPPNSEFVVTSKDTTRLLLISNSYSTVSIKMQCSGFGVAQQGIWGVISPPTDDLNRYYTIDFDISINIKTSRFKKYSPEMKEYMRWHENLVLALQIANWEQVDKQIEQQAFREAIQKMANSSASSDTIESD